MTDWLHEFLWHVRDGLLHQWKSTQHKKLGSGKRDVSPLFEGVFYHKRLAEGKHTKRFEQPTEKTAGTIYMRVSDV